MALIALLPWVFPLLLLMYSALFLKQLPTLTARPALGLVLLGTLSVLYTIWWISLWGGFSYTSTIDITALVYFLIPTYLALSLGAVLIIAGCYRYAVTRKNAP